MYRMLPGCVYISTFVDPYRLRIVKVHELPGVPKQTYETYARLYPLESAAANVHDQLRQHQSPSSHLDRRPPRREGSPTVRTCDIGPVDVHDQISVDQASTSEIPQVLGIKRSWNGVHGKAQPADRREQCIWGSRHIATLG